MDAKEAGFLALALSQQRNGGFNYSYSAQPPLPPRRIVLVATGALTLERIRGVLENLNN